MYRSVSVIQVVGTMHMVVKGKVLEGNSIHVLLGLAHHQVT